VAAGGFAPDPCAHPSPCVCTRTQPLHHHPARSTPQRYTNQDTDADGIVPPHQQVVLTYRADATVATADEPPVVLGRMPQDWVARMGPKLLRPGRLLRFSLQMGGLRFEGGRPAGADLKYEGPANQRRGRANVFSKVLFQAQARSGEAPTLAQLQAKAAAAELDGSGSDDVAGGVDGSAMAEDS